MQPHLPLDPTVETTVSYSVGLYKLDAVFTDFLDHGLDHLFGKDISNKQS